MTLSKILKIFLLVILDLSVFIFCGIYMMGYEDLYDESQGEYFGFSSMKMEYKIVWGFYNFWIVLNCVLFFYFIYTLYRKFSLK
jgi:hypothetical protein